MIVSGTEIDILSLGKPRSLVTCEWNNAVDSLNYPVFRYILYGLVAGIEEKYQWRCRGKATTVKCLKNVGKLLKKKINGENRQLATWTIKGIKLGWCLSFTF